MTATEVQFKLRLPSELKDRLDKAAAASGRSLSAEMVKRLEDSFPTTEQMLIASRVEELDRISRLRQEQERLFYQLLENGHPSWEVEYREYSRLHAIERSLQDEIDGYANLREWLDGEATSEIERIKEDEKNKDRRDYTITSEGIDMLGRKSA